MKVISSYIPFPAISWWAHIINANTLLLDGYEHYEKMTLRNKYRIAGANNPIQLSIPLTGGRDQRRPMKDITIHNEEKWQVQHWRTLTSVYRQSPFWEFYEPTLEPLFTTTYPTLVAFNRATLLWCIKQLKLDIEIRETEHYLKSYPNEYKDLRRSVKATPPAATFPRYYQLFEERTGFLPDLSILDLLFAEGPHTVAWLKQNASILTQQ